MKSFAFSFKNFWTSFYIFFNWKERIFLFFSYSTTIGLWPIRAKVNLIARRKYFWLFFHPGWFVFVEDPEKNNDDFVPFGSVVGDLR